MTRLQQVERRADKLPAPQRAALAARLLVSLPPVLTDRDHGVAEAKRRDAELDANPDTAMSEEEFRLSVAAARKR
jgi:hypothetical protein